MNTYLYDASTNAFYPLILQADYESSGTWPEHGVEVDDDTFASFQNPPAGKMRAPDSNGNPSWVDIPPPTKEDLIAAAENERQSRIDAANDFMNRKQWPGKVAIGRLKGDELAQYNLWLDYLEALEAVDTSSAPDINWPVPPVV